MDLEMAALQSVSRSQRNSSKKRGREKNRKEVRGGKVEVGRRRIVFV